jgi:hypothetical protein
MFETSAPFVLFDYFRVPHERVAAGADAAGVERVAVAGETPALGWPGENLLRTKGCRPGIYRLGDLPIPGRVLPDTEMRALTARLPGAWRPSEPVRDARGTAVSAVWRAEDGSTLLPFDPNEVVANFWTERYVEFGPKALAARLAAVGRRAYYLARPLLPRSVQLRLRRSFSHIQGKTRFPRWPVETALDDLFAFLFGAVADLGEEPIPFIAAWPREWAWAFVLTHDVEQRVGYDNLHELLDVELEEGYRSSWNFVPCNGYVVEHKVLERLRGDGFEIGVHGLFHDGRDVLPRTLPGRLPAIRAYADQWGAVGFRSPGTIRSAQMLSKLGFDYDSSYSDTAPFEPQAGGCCSWLPYMIERTVELPITLVQDHTLFDLLQYPDETLWVDKARLVRERGGMALVLTHSDYVGNRRLGESYRRLLQEFRDDPSAWKALPRDVTAWWKRRSESRLELVDGEWEIVVPAPDEGRVDFFDAARTHVGAPPVR